MISHSSFFLKPIKHGYVMDDGLNLHNACDWDPAVCGKSGRLDYCHWAQFGRQSARLCTHSKGFGKARMLLGWGKVAQAASEGGKLRDLVLNHLRGIEIVRPTTKSCT